MHRKQERKRYDKERGSASSRGYDARWRKVREVVLSDEPLCRRCVAAGRVVAAEMVHHIDRNPRNNQRDNLEPICRACHEAEHKNERYGKLWGGGVSL